MSSLGGFGMYIGATSGGGGGGLPPDGIYGQITVSGSGTVWMVNQTADVNIGTFKYIGSGVQANSSAGGYLYSNSGAQAMQWGAGGGQNVTFYDGVKLDAKTASRILTTDASKNLATDLSLTTDGTLSANSDTNVPSEKAVKTYADSKVAQTITNGVTTSAPSQDAVFYALAGKEPALGYTPENVSNKSTDTALGTSNTLYPSQNAVKTYADGKVVQTITSGVTTSAPSQDAVFNALAGKEPSLGYTPENVDNKSTDTNLGSSNTLYPTQNAVKTYVDNRSGQAAFIEIEKNIATNPKKSGKFTITSSGLTVGKQVIILQATAPYTGKGNMADESEMDGITVKGVVTSATNIDCYWTCETYVKGNFKFNYLVSE